MSNINIVVEKHLMDHRYMEFFQREPLVRFLGLVEVLVLGGLSVQSLIF